MSLEGSSKVADLGQTASVFSPDLLGWFYCLLWKKVEPHEVVQPVWSILSRGGFIFDQSFNLFAQFSILFPFLFCFILLFQLDLCMFYCCPVETLEKPMLFNLIGITVTQSFLPFRLQKSLNQIFRLWRQHSTFVAYWRPLQLPIENVRVDLLNCLSAKWSNAYKHFVDHNAKTPPIYGLIGWILGRQDLWGCVVWGAHNPATAILWLVVVIEG